MGEVIKVGANSALARIDRIDRIDCKSRQSLSPFFPFLSLFLLFCLTLDMYTRSQLDLLVDFPELVELLDTSNVSIITIIRKTFLLQKIIHIYIYIYIYYNTPSSCCRHRRRYPQLLVLFLTSINNTTLLFTFGTWHFSLVYTLHLRINDNNFK